MFKKYFWLVLVRFLMFLWDELLFFLKIRVGGYYVKG